jgi:hypothetical protein
MTGSNPVYVEAAGVVLDMPPEVMNEVLAGRISVLAAARRGRRAARVVAAARKAGPDDLATAGRTLGPEVIWDRMLVPALR